MNKLVRYLFKSNFSLFELVVILLLTYWRTKTTMTGLMPDLIVVCGMIVLSFCVTFIQNKNKV